MLCVFMDAILCSLNFLAYHYLCMFFLVQVSLFCFAFTSRHFKLSSRTLRHITIVLQVSQCRIYLFVNLSSLCYFAHRSPEQLIWTPIARFEKLIIFCCEIFREFFFDKLGRYLSAL